MRTISCITLAVLMLGGLSLGQTNPSDAGQENQAARHAKRQPSDLASRSEMQQPKPIPIVNSLRLPEIPVCSGSTRFALRTDDSQQIANPGQTNPTLQPVDCVAPAKETQLFSK